MKLIILDKPLHFIGASGEVVATFISGTGTESRTGRTLASHDNTSHYRKSVHKVDKERKMLRFCDASLFLRHASCLIIGLILDSVNLVWRFCRGYFFFFFFLSKRRMSSDLLTSLIYINSRRNQLALCDA